MQNLQLKQQLRAIMQTLRQQQTSTQIAQLHPKMMAGLLHFATYVDARAVLAYCGDTARGEIDTLPILQYTLETGKLLGLPRIEGRVVEGQMRLHQTVSLTDLLRSKLGFLEPLPSAPNLLVSDFDLIIVPGIAFDRKGNRLGAGGGFYDRLLAQKTCLTVALAFDYQMVEAVPVEPHDLAIDFIITESQTIDCKK